MKTPKKIDIQEEKIDIVKLVNDLVDSRVTRIEKEEVKKIVEELMPDIDLLIASQVKSHLSTLIFELSKITSTHRRK